MRKVFIVFYYTTPAPSAPAPDKKAPPERGPPLKDFSISTKKRLDLESAPSPIMFAMKETLDNGETPWSISEMAALSGLSEDTLRFYEKKGLLPGVKRGPDGRRQYDAANLRAVKLIDCLKKTGMPLDDIAEFMRLTTLGDSSVAKRLEMMRKRAATVKAMMADLQASADHVAFKVWYYETAAREGLAALADVAGTLERYRAETGRSFSP